MRLAMIVTFGAMFFAGCGENVSEEIANSFDFDVAQADRVIGEHIAHAIVAVKAPDVDALELELADEWDAIRAELRATITRMEDCNPNEEEQHLIDLAARGITLLDAQVDDHVTEQRRSSTMAECLSCESEFIGHVRNPTRILEEASEDLRVNFKCREAGD